MRLIAVAALLGALLVAGSVRSGPPARPDHGAWDELLGRYVTPYGVRYAAWHGSDRDRQRLNDYLVQLRDFEISKLGEVGGSRDEQLAYWINLYNALTVKQVLDNYPIESFKDLGNLIRSPWKQTVIRIEGKDLSLDQIENDIIRPRFGEPRIHFALNCAAVGCPPLRAGAFLPSQLDAQLEQQTSLFLGSPKRNWVDEEGRLHLSKILDWYKDDFTKAAGSVPAYVRPYMSMLQEVKPGSDIEIEYVKYDWTLNEAKDG